MQMIGLLNWEGIAHGLHVYVNKTNWMCIEIESQLNRIGFKKRLTVYNEDCRVKGSRVSERYDNRILIFELFKLACQYAICRDVTLWQVYQL